MRRLPEGGRHIDRRRPVSFEFDGEQLSGYEGDTLASALLANGKRLVARSYKYHRPRGILGSGAEEPNAYMRIGEGSEATPNQRATETLLVDGMKAESQNRFPSLAFDMGAINDYLSGLFPPGFYYKTFIHPRFAWKHIYEPLIRRVAGMGMVPRGRDPDWYEHFYYEVDVLVVGAGPSGIAAARTLADTGARVLLAEQTPWVGGRLLGDRVRIGGKGGAEWASSEVAELVRRKNVQVRTSAMAAALYDHNYALLYERSQEPGAPRRRLWRVRARKVILATGAIERPTVFSGNDFPGVMLASAVRDYIRRWAVAPGSGAVVHTLNDSAYETAIALMDSGVEVRRIVDARRDPNGPLVNEARNRGIPVSAGAGIVARTRGKRVCAVDIVPIRASGRPGSQKDRVACDLVAISGGWSPTAHLYCHSGGRLAWDVGAAMFRPDPECPPVGADGETSAYAAGAAAGLLGTSDALESGRASALRALEDLGFDCPEPGETSVEEHAEEPAEVLWIVPGEGFDASGKRNFVDFQHDVTVADLELAVREGYSEAELAKRYTTLGMAPDQGKVSNVAGHAIIADAAGRALDASGTTTIRPPYTPITLGAIAGSARGKVFRAIRETPPYDWHAENGADFEPVGEWRRPYCYRGAGESRSEAVAREILSVRSGVGIIDATTLGKLIVKGPDAGQFLDLIYTNTISTLAVGRCRYVLMCNDAGYLFDDGVVVRLGADSFLCHTTTGGTERVHAWLEEWLQTEWFTLRVYVANVTEQWAQFAVAGPRSRELLQNLGDGVDFGDDSLPYLGMAEGTLRGAPARVFRISFSGELAYEVAVPAEYGASLWETLLDAGQAYGITVYGTEALHVMRAEQGFIMIGDETDGTVTPTDLGLSWAVSKKKPDFIGKRGMQMPHLAANDREQLVGLLTEDPQTVLPDGACAVEKERGDSYRIIGHVTSTYHSPTLKRSIAMGLIRRGRERKGETVTFMVANRKLVRATISELSFLESGRGSGHV